MLLGIFAATHANAQNSNRYAWWNYFFGGHQECHSHQGNYAAHYFWTRYLWWHNHCPNQAPVADAGIDQEVNGKDTVNLDGSASSDADGMITRYRWRQIGGPLVRLRGRRTATPTFVAPDVTEATALTYVLRVRDNLRARDRDTVTVTVNPGIVVSLPPVADAGDDQTVNEETSVTLYGSASSDPDNDITEYLWQQTAGTSVVLSNADMAAASFAAPELSVAEVLEFSLLVTDAEGNTDTVAITVEPVIPTSQVNVRVRTLDASLVSGVGLEFYVDGLLRDDLSAVVNETATLSIDADVNYSVRTNANGFAVQVIPFRSAAEDNNVDLDITLMPRGDTITISGAGSFSEEGDNGASVSFTTADFVDADGNPVVGDIQLTITPVDVSQPATLAEFPGEFTGVLEGSATETPIISLGTVEFEFTANGQPINLADGATADILIPIYNFTYQDGTNIAVGNTIPLWSLDEDTGIWEQEGTGTVVASIDSPTGLALSGTVSHFSWWNCDVSMNAGSVEVTVLGPDNGTATVFGRTEASIGWRPSQVDTTVAVNGTTNPLFIPSNAETCLWAEVNFVSGASVTTAEQCVTPSPKQMLSVTFGAGSIEPLDVLASPGDATDIVSLNDFLQSPIDTITLSPVSIETQVTYSITSGALPAGVVLTAINATQAEIAGISTESGTFSATILSTDDAGNTDEVVVNVTVSDQVDPPILNDEGRGIFFPPEELITVDLNQFNSGGTAVNWSIEDPLPDWLSFSNTTGILLIDTTLIPEGPGGPNDGPIDDDFLFTSFFSDVTATNTGGSSTSRLAIEAFLPEGVSVRLDSGFDQF